MLNPRPVENEQPDDRFIRYIASLGKQTVHYFPGSSDIDFAIAHLALYDLFRSLGIDYVTHSSLEALNGALVMMGPGDHASGEDARSFPSRFDALLRNNRVVFVPQNTMRFVDIARLSLLGATIFCHNTSCLELALLQGADVEHTHFAQNLAFHLFGKRRQPSRTAGSGTLAVGGISFCNALGFDAEHSVLSAYHHSINMGSRDFCQNVVQGLTTLFQYYDTIVTDRSNIALLAAASEKSVILHCDPTDSQGGALEGSTRVRFPTLVIQTEFASLREAGRFIRSAEHHQPMPPIENTQSDQMSRGDETQAPPSADDEIMRLKATLFDTQRRAELLFQEQRREIAYLSTQRRDAENRYVMETLSAEEHVTVAAGRRTREPRFFAFPAVQKRLSELEAPLRTELKEAQVSEAAAYRMARSAWQVIGHRQRELERNAIDLEVAAEKARAEVVRLASEAARLYDVELAMARTFTAKQESLSRLLSEGQTHLASANAKSLAWIRPWNNRAKRSEALLGSIVELSAEVNRAHYDLNVATEQRRIAEDLGLKAEPNASELASAAVVTRAEHSATSEMITSLKQYSHIADALWVNDYGRWVSLYDTLTEGDRRAIKARMMRLAYKPLISVVMPVYQTPLPLLRKAIESVRTQLYENWELCIADDASPNPDVFGLLQSLSEADQRIKLIRRDCNGHIAAASNSALSLSTGEFIALLDHDDLLAEQALFEVVVSLNKNPQLDIVYSDEDHIDENDVRSNPYFKTDYNQELMLGHNLLNHLSVYRRGLVEKLGGFRVGYEGSQDYDLALRVIDATTPDRIEHIPAVLYHWRSNTQKQTFSEAESQRCISSARQALSDHLDRVHQLGEVKAHPNVPAWHLVGRSRPDPAPLVSIIVPTKDKVELIQPCIEGLLNRTRYPNFEIIVVDHQSTDAATLELFESFKTDKRIRIITYAGAFNYSAINNFAVTTARGSVLALLNNDVDVISEAWLDEMVALAILPDVGAVGAKLLYADGRVQHAGIVLGPGGVAGHLFHRLEADDPGYFGRAVLTADVAAVTAACLVVRKAVFEEVGGFDDVNLPIAFNDVDLCLKIRQNKYRNVWTPQACLYHHESVSRGSDQRPERVDAFNAEVAFMLQKWEGLLESDPFYNLNLDLTSADFSLAFPPRRRKSWRTNDVV